MVFFSFCFVIATNTAVVFLTTQLAMRTFIVFIFYLAIGIAGYSIFRKEKTWILFVIIISPMLILNIYGLYVNHGHFPHRFPAWLIVSIVAVIIGILFTKKNYRPILILLVATSVLFMIFYRFWVPSILMARYSETPPANREINESICVIAPDSSSLFLDSVKGKIVLIDFWFPQCKPCVEKKNALNQLYNQLGELNSKVVLISLLSDSLTTFKDFYNLVVSRYKNYPKILCYDPQAKLGRTLFVKRMPYEVVIGPDGKIYTSLSGYTENFGQVYVSNRIRLFNYLLNNYYEDKH